MSTGETESDPRFAARLLRRRYDGDEERKPRPGEIAAIKRLGTVGDALLEGAFWSLANPSLSVLMKNENGNEAELAYARERLATALAIVVCAFPCAGASSFNEPFGTWLWTGLAKRKIPEEAAARRFRQLAAARTADELAHRLRALLRLIAEPVDWVTLTHDVLQWTRNDRSRDAVLRRWAQDFYAPQSQEAEQNSNEAVTND